MKRLILYVSFSCLFSAPIWAQSLSWTEALDRMQNHNQKLKGIEKQTEAATEGKKAYQGLYLPQLSLNASYMHLADPLSLNFNDYKTPFTNRSRRGVPSVSSNAFASITAFSRSII